VGFEGYDYHDDDDCEWSNGDLEHDRSGTAVLDPPLPATHCALAAAIGRLRDRGLTDLQQSFR